MGKMVNRKNFLSFSRHHNSKIVSKEIPEDTVSKMPINMNYIRYRANVEDSDTDGSGGVYNLPGSTAYPENGEAIISMVIPKRPGCRFVGWSPNPKADVGDEKYRGGMIYRGESVNLYAIWTTTFENNPVVEKSKVPRKQPSQTVIIPEKIILPQLNDPYVFKKTSVVQMDAQVEVFKPTPIVTNIKEETIAPIEMQQVYEEMPTKFKEEPRTDNFTEKESYENEHGKVLTLRPLSQSRYYLQPCKRMSMEITHFLRK